MIIKWMNSNRIITAKSEINKAKKIIVIIMDRNKTKID